MKIIECPRDAMQGIGPFIPTEIKIEYLNLLLKVGFDTLDFGSFVSPKAIPQLRDTEAVLKGLDLSLSQTKLLAIVANTRGAQEAASHPEISYLGFPFSISETFQLRNTNKTIEEALISVAEIIEICQKSNKTPVVYISMGFGNPYGDHYSEDIVAEYTQKLSDLGAGILALSDTIGSSTPQQIEQLFSFLQKNFPAIEFGAHLHATPMATEEKIKAVLASGVRRIDTAIKGYGGCPMASDSLTGNVATEKVLDVLEREGINHGLAMEPFTEALHYSARVFAHV
jgi:hydroxymethylglutaryl-CoA lyase